MVHRLSSVRASLHIRKPAAAGSGLVSHGVAGRFRPSSLRGFVVAPGRPAGTRALSVVLSAKLSSTCRGKLWQTFASTADSQRAASPGSCRGAFSSLHLTCTQAALVKRCPALNAQVSRAGKRAREGSSCCIVGRLSPSSSPRTRGGRKGRPGNLVVFRATGVLYGSLLHARESSSWSLAHRAAPGTTRRGRLRIL